MLTSDWQADQVPVDSTILRQLALIDYQQPSYQQKWQVEQSNYKLTQQAIRDWQPDLVYIWSQRLVSLAPLWAVQDLNCKRVFEIGDFWPDSYLKPGFKAWAKRQLKQFIPGLLGGPIQIDPVISVSQWMIPEIKAKYGSQQIQFIPNGIPVPQQSQADWQEPLKVLFVGRLDPEKGLHLALEALADLKNKGIVLPLSIAGQGDADYTRQCHQLVHERGLEAQVQWLGWKHDLEAIYAGHQLLLMPTLMREPFGLVIIEAMMRGLVVFASDAYGPAEIIQSGHNGYLFKPGSSQSLADCLAMALKTPSDLVQIGQSAAHESRRSYALDQVKKQVEQILYQQAGITPCQRI